MIFLVSLACPAGHRNGGAPYEYASADPPAAWFDTMSRDAWREVKRHPEQWARCIKCGVPFNGQWQIIVDSMKANTMEEAERDLASISKAPYPTPGERC